MKQETTNSKRLKKYEHKIIEQKMSITKNIQNTHLIDAIKKILKRHNFSVICTNYDGLIMTKNESFFLFRITCQPVVIKAIKIEIIFDYQQINKQMIVQSHGINKDEVRQLFKLLKSVVSDEISKLTRSKHFLQKHPGFPQQRTRFGEQDRKLDGG